MWVDSGAGTRHKRQKQPPDLSKREIRGLLCVELCSVADGYRTRPRVLRLPQVVSGGPVSRLVPTGDLAFFGHA